MMMTDSGPMTAEQAATLKRLANEAYERPCCWSPHAGDIYLTRAMDTSAGSAKEGGHVRISCPKRRFAH